jgi:hypothetical protein
MQRAPCGLERGRLWLVAGAAQDKGLGPPGCRAARGGAPPRSSGGARAAALTLPAPHSATRSPTCPRRQIAPGVWAQREPDCRHCLLGMPLRHIPKLLKRIFK